uniref:Odorant receptor n=1 Tax=Phlebotomus papatasi TaxID=29031 RepID=A0A3F2ZEK8_PHLPP
MSQQSLSEACWDTFKQLSDTVRFIGCNGLDFDHRKPPNIFTYITIFLVILLHIMGLTSMYLFSDSLEKMAEAIFTVVIAAQAGAKVYMVARDFTIFHELVNLATGFVAEYLENPNVCSIFRRYINACNIFRRYIARLYTFVGIGLIGGSISIPVITKTKILPYGGVLPILDHESDYGYLINLVTYMFIIIYGVFGFFVSDYFYLNAMFMACGQIETIDVICQDLTTYLEKHEPHEIRKIDSLIAMIVKTQQRHTKYMAVFDEQFSLHSFVIIMSSMMGIAISMFLFLKKGWINGVLMIIVFFWEIFTLCLMGGIYLIKLEKAEIELYETKWYLLPEKKQRMFVCIIQYMQAIKEPAALSYVPLNFNTFVNCLKLMYQLLMVLLNMST